MQRGRPSRELNDVSATHRVVATSMRELQERAGGTQERLATRLGCSRGYVAQLQRGMKLPGPQMREALAREFPNDPAVTALLDAMARKPPPEPTTPPPPYFSVRTGSQGSVSISLHDLRACALTGAGGGVAAAARATKDLIIRSAASR